MWLLQKGSPESKELGKAGRESDKDQLVGRYAENDSPVWARVEGLRTRLYSSSLALVMGSIFLASWLVQGVAGWAAYSETRLQRVQDPIGWGSYLVHPDFWARTLQNWQSEFLAVGAMAVFSVYPPAARLLAEQAGRGTPQRHRGRRLSDRDEPHIEPSTAQTALPEASGAPEGTAQGDQAPSASRAAAGGGPPPP